MDSAQLKKKTDKKGKNAQLWTMRVTLIAKRITILFANKLDEVLIRVTLRCRVGLRERKIGNGGNGFWFPPYFHVLNSRRWQKAKQKIAIWNEAGCGTEKCHGKDTGSRYEDQCVVYCLLSCRIPM